MKATYPKAMAAVYEWEGGYSNDVGDSGGPTNYGITIDDARHYWKAGATAEDVRGMPKSVAADIYQKHYADPIHYDDLPAGVDLAVFDYGINSGIHRSVTVLQGIVGAPKDGVIGPVTLAAVATKTPEAIVKAIYAERLAFLQGLAIWSRFGKGWARRCKEGEALCQNLISEYSTAPAPIPAPAPPVRIPPVTTTTTTTTVPAVSGLESFALSFIAKLLPAPFGGALTSMLPALPQIVQLIQTDQQIATQVAAAPDLPSKLSVIASHLQQVGSELQGIVATVIGGSAPVVSAGTTPSPLSGIGAQIEALIAAAQKQSAPAS
jgi:lysozyme family protein